MAEKDIAEKQLEDFPDVFTDIVNVLLFDGNQSKRFINNRIANWTVPMLKFFWSLLLQFLIFGIASNLS